MVHVCFDSVSEASARIDTYPSNLAHLEGVVRTVSHTCTSIPERSRIYAISKHGLRRQSAGALAFPRVVELRDHVGSLCANISSLPSSFLQRTRIPAACICTQRGHKKIENACRGSGAARRVGIKRCRCRCFSA